MTDKEKIRAYVKRLQKPEGHGDYWKGYDSALNDILSFIDPKDKDLKTKFKVGQTITDPTHPTFTFHINKIEDGKYIERDEAWVLIPEADKEYQLVEDSGELTHSVIKISDQEEPGIEVLEAEFSKYLDGIIDKYQKEHCDSDADYLMSKEDLLDVARHFASWGTERYLRAKLTTEFSDVVARIAEKACYTFEQGFAVLQSAQIAYDKGKGDMKQQLMKGAILEGWVARDENESLHIFEVEPSRISHRWWDRDYQSTSLDNKCFPDLKWEDEPVYVKLVIIEVR